MIDLTTKSLPDTLTVNGRDFRLNTDFRIWIRFIRECKQTKYESKDYMDVSYLFADDMPTYIDITLLYEWALPRCEIPRDIGKHIDAIVIDYDIDADLIFSAFMQQYGIDITAVDMHWYKFMALIRGIGSDTKLGRIMGYRVYEKNDISRDEYMKEQQRIWEIEEPLTREQQAGIDELNALFE